MMQLDMEKQAEQLNEAIRTRDALEKVKMLDDAVSNGSVKPGNAVETTQGNFYIAISAGQLKVNGQTYFAVSPATPIGSKLMGLKVGEGSASTAKTTRSKRSTSEHDRPGPDEAFDRSLVNSPKPDIYLA